MRRAEASGGTRPEPDPAADAWVEVCMEMALRPFGLGHPYWESSSQHDLLSTLLGERYRADPPFHMERTNYLIRRVRARWKPPRI